MTYLGKPYYPVWLDNLADEVTLEAAAMDGAAQGADAVRSVLVTARESPVPGQTLSLGRWACGWSGLVEHCQQPPGRGDAADSRSGQAV